MKALEDAFVRSPKEEFRQFAESRMEGMGLTANDEQIQLVREAMERGISILEGGSPCD